MLDIFRVKNRILNVFFLVAISESRVGVKIHIVLREENLRILKEIGIIYHVTTAIFCSNVTKGVNCTQHRHCTKNG